MLLREMTSSAFAHSFKRFARLAVAGLALAGLAACGGGGGGGNASPEMTITPAPTADQLEAATVISAGEPVDGTLESADDVKYYRLDVAETSVVEFTLDAEAGTEIALLDSSGGVVLVHAVTASEATVRHTVRQGSIYARVRNAVKKANQNRLFRLVNRVTKVTAYAGTVIDVLRGIPKGEIPIGPGGAAGISYDLRGVFSRPDDQPLTYRVGGHAGLLSVKIERESLRLTSTGDAVPGPLTLTLTATLPDVDNIPGASVSWTLTLIGAGRVKPEYSDGVRERVETGLTYVSPQLGGYFEFPAGSELSYRLQGALRDSTGFTVNGARWHLAQGTDRVSVTVPSGQSLPVTSDATVIARDQHGTEATLRFFITFAAGEPAQQGEGIAIACIVNTFTCIELTAAQVAINPISDTATCTSSVNFWAWFDREQVPQCPRTGGYPIITSCLLDGKHIFSYDPQSAIEGNVGGAEGVIQSKRAFCLIGSGSNIFTIHKQP